MAYIGSNPKFITQSYRAQSSDPSNPIEGTVFRSDGTPRAKGLWEYRDGSWQRIAGSTSNNYILNPDMDNNVTNWATYADAAGVAPVNGTGGSPNITFASSATTPLRGPGSGLLTKGAANRQGEGISTDFTIDTADKGRMLQISFDYTTATGYVDNDIRIYIYDVTNSTLIEPSQRDLLATSLNGQYVAFFQTPTTSTSYRLIYHISSTSATAYPLKIDNVKLGPIDIASSGASKACKIYRATSAFSVAAATETTVQFNTTKYDLSGMATLGSYAITAPESGLYLLNCNLAITGLTNDESLILRLKVDGTAVLTSTMADPVSDTASSIICSGAVQLTKGAVITATVDSAADTAYDISLDASATSSFLEAVLLQSDASDLNRSVIAFKAYRAAAANQTSTGAAQQVQLDTIQYDTAGGWVGGSYRWVAPESGYYFLLGNVAMAGIADTKGIQPYLYVNGSSIAVGDFVPGGASGSRQGNVNTIILLNKGDYVELFAYQNDGASEAYSVGAENTYLAGFKINCGVLSLAPTENIVAVYNTNAGQSISSGAAAAIIDFEDKVVDTHNAVTTGASWKFTAPISGYYNVSFLTTLAANTGWSGAESLYVSIYTDGAETSREYEYPNGGGVSIEAVNRHNRCIYLGKGSYVDIRIVQNSGGAIALSGTATNVWVSINKI